MVCFLFIAAVSLAADENWVTVTHIRSVSVKQRQDNKPYYLHRLSDILVGHLSLSKQLLVLMLSTLASHYTTA